MFIFTAHCVSALPRQVRLPAQISLVHSGTTVASRGAAARRPAPAFAPAPRSPPTPTPTLLTQPAPGAGPLVDDIHGACTRRATPPAPPLSGKFRQWPTPTALPAQVGITPPQCAHSRLSAARAARARLAPPGSPARPPACASSRSSRTS